LSLSATATRLSARRPRRPATDDAVDGAILSVARLRLRQGRARRSAERRLRRDTARLRLDTAAACLGTGRPGGPRAHSAVDGARLRVARLRLPQGRARQATVRRPGQHRPRLSLHTATAHLAARRPRRPRAHLAVNGAVLRVANLLLHQGWAGRPAVSRCHRHGALRRLETNATRARASRPGRPRTDDAIDRALLGVAVLRLHQHGARRAAVGRCHPDGARLALGTRAALLVAGRPSGPGTDDAVDGARLGVAGLFSRQGRARYTAKGRRQRHSARGRLQTTAAGLGAGRPRGPAIDHAVDGAGLRVAFLGLQQSRARGATMRRRHRHGAGLRLHTTTTRLGAGRPRGPAADGTPDGAGLGVADLRLGHGRAGDAAKSRLRGDRASAGLTASATGHGTGRPGGPGAHLTVDGARLGVARLRCDGLGASLVLAGRALRLAATGAGHGTRLNATAARLGARRPRTRAPVWARLRVARLLLRQVGASGTAVRRRLGDGAGLPLHAATAHCRAGGPRGPATDGAIDGTRLRVAGLRLRQGRASSAAKGSIHHDRAGGHPHARAARLGAPRPRRPRGDGAVDGARSHVAVLSVDQARARVATVGRLHRDGTRLTLQATAARGRAGRPR